MSNILNIGKSALNAANVAISTTGNNIANATTPGYSRQAVQQAAVAGQYMGYGYIGKGTEITAVSRVYNEFLGNQVLTAQSASGQLNTYYSQIQQIDNMLADTTVGLSPSVQNFFKSVQDVSAASGSASSRQTLLSSAQTLAASFQSLATQLKEISQGVNDQITSSVTAINSYSKQIAQLNDAIEKSQGIADGNMPNDLLDQRDLAIANLSKEVKVSIVKQGNSYDIYIGNGQPLVVGASTYDLKAVPSTTDANRMEVAYVNYGKTSILAENSLTGGNLAGLFEFRSQTLIPAENSLGRMAIALASDFNAQHKLGIDLSGVQGGDFFNLGQPQVYPSSSNSQTSPAVVTASISDSSLLTISDYQLKYDGTNYSLTRLSDSQSLFSGSSFSAAQDAAKAEGFNVSLDSGTIASGDTFLIRPTMNGASGISVAITDTSKIAAAAPILTAKASGNTGSGKISAGSVDATFAQSTVATPITLTFDDGPPKTLSGFPSVPVSVMVNGVAVTGSPFAAGAAVPYTDGATISFAGISLTLSGTPADTDKFTIGPNPSGAGDNRNMLLLGALQTANTVSGKSTTYQGAYSQLVNMIGNKTSELESTSTAAGNVLTQAKQSQQSVSGVNLDEEAANLMRYQQAYQAAAKVMKMAGDLFDAVLAINN